MTSYNSLHIVAPLSRKDLRDYAAHVRKSLNINTPYMPIVNLLESLYHILRVNWDILSDSEFNLKYDRDSQARYDLDKKCIYIRESVYDNAANDYGRDRFTVAHEIAHALLLDSSNVSFARTSTEAIPKYRNPEWQAECLAGELLMPYEFCKSATFEEIVNQCKVSKSAARYQKKFAV